MKAGRGVRRPQLSWSCPTLGISGDLAVVFEELVSNAGDGFVLKDELGNKMKLGKFHNLSRKLFASLQAAPHLSSLTNCTSYMARRSLPTAADVLGSSSSDRAAVGGWMEKETAGTVGQAARRLRVPCRYSGIGATSALVVKAHIIQVVSRMREQGAPTSAAWDHVPVLFPRLSGLRKLQKDNVLVSKQLVTPTERLESVSSSASSLVGPTLHTCSSPLLLDVFQWFHGHQASALVHLLKRDAACSPPGLPA